MTFVQGVVTGLLLVGGKRAGTVWFIREDICVTAAHCVGGAESRTVSGETMKIRCLGKERTARVLDTPNFDIDVALLRVTPSVPKEAPPRIRAATKDDVGRHWQGHGYPAANPDGLHLTGRLTAIDASAEGAPALQLSCDQGGFDKLEGCSGAPVQCGDAIVGIIRWAPEALRQKVIFATRASEIAKAFPNVISVFETPLNVPNAIRLRKALDVVLTTDNDVHLFAASYSPQAYKDFGNEMSVSTKISKIASDEKNRSLIVKALLSIAKAEPETWSKVVEILQIDATST